MNSIELTNISKHYGSVQALNDVSLSVKQGEVFGLIGPEDVPLPHHGHTAVA